MATVLPLVVGSGVSLLSSIIGVVWEFERAHRTSDASHHSVFMSGSMRPSAGRRAFCVLSFACLLQACCPCNGLPALMGAEVLVEPISKVRQT